MMKKLKSKKGLNAGMTFLELIVVLGIFGAISATVLFNYGDFSSNVNLQNLAQDVAVQIKKVQTDAVSGRLPALSDAQNTLLSDHLPPDWTPSYGVAFTTTGAPNLSDDDGHAFFYYFNSASDNQNGDLYKDFWDFEGGNYTTPCGAEAESECLDEIYITSGDSVDLICFDFVDITPDDDCTGDGTSSDRAYISFTRPRANAYITNSATPGEDSDRSNVYIRLRSPSGAHKYVAVWESGYISVK